MRHMFRRLRHDPGLTLLVTLTLALGVGVNSAMFSLVNALHRPLPAVNAERLVVLATRQGTGSAGMEGMQYRFTYPALADFRAQAQSYSDLIAFDLGHGGLTTGGKPQEFIFAYVSGNYFSALGIEPAAGRLFRPGEGEAPDSAVTVVLGHSYWMKQFGGDPGVIGRQVRLNGAPATIIGIAEKQFHGTYANTDMHGFVPLSYIARSHFQDRRGFFHDRTGPRLTVMGMLKPGVTLAQARSEAQVIAKRLEQQYPATDKGISVNVLPETWARPAPVPALVAMAPIVAGVFLAMGLLVLLLACLNVSNILLVRAAAREREIAVRAALGSGRARLVGQALAECLVLALLGGAAGVLLSAWATDAVSSLPMALGNLEAVLDASFDWRVFAYALGATLLAAVMAGLWPALAASRAGIATTLHECGRGASATRGTRRLRNTMVVAQVAGSLTLLIVAGCFAAGLANARRLNLGFDPQHLGTFTMDAAYAGYDRERSAAFYRDLERRVRELPGVQSASVAFSAPLSYVQDGDNVQVEGQSPAPGKQNPLVMLNSVTPDYFKTLRLDLRRGRGLLDSDDEDAPRVAVINEVMARRLWPDQDPLGKRFRIQRTADRWWQVVGVVRDSKYFALFEPPLPFFYVPAAQQYYSRRVLHVRSPLPPKALMEAVEREVRALAPDLPVTEAAMMGDSLEGATGLYSFRLGAYLSGVMGLVGLLLAAVGVYGVVTYAVGQRTHEIGIRMALGAEPAQVLRLVWGRGGMLVAAGVVIGVLSALMLVLLINHWASEAVDADFRVFLVTTGVLAAVALWACYVPARRAMALDPVSALRHE
jgi:predicted permease